MADRKPKPDCYDYIRRTYSVPACVGKRITFRGKSGVIVASRSDLHYLHVRFDGTKFPVNVHPTDGVEYASDIVERAEPPTVKP